MKYLHLPHRICCIIHPVDILSGQILSTSFDDSIDYPGNCHHDIYFNMYMYLSDVYTDRGLLSSTSMYYNKVNQYRCMQSSFLPVFGQCELLADSMVTAFSHPGHVFSSVCCLAHMVLCFPFTQTDNAGPCVTCAVCMQNINGAETLPVT